MARSRRSGPPWPRKTLKSSTRCFRVSDLYYQRFDLPAHKIIGEDADVCIQTRAAQLLSVLWGVLTDNSPRGGEGSDAGLLPDAQDARQLLVPDASASTLAFIPILPAPPAPGLLLAPGPRWGSGGTGGAAAHGSRRPTAALACRTGPVHSSLVLGMH